MWELLTGLNLVLVSIVMAAFMQDIVVVKGVGPLPYLASGLCQIALPTPAHEVVFIWFISSYISFNFLLNCLAVKLT